MITTETYVRARIDTLTKERATNALEVMGLTVSDIIRMLMLGIVDEHQLPFKIKVPNKITIKARSELERGKGKKVRNIKLLMAELNERD